MRELDSRLFLHDSDKKAMDALKAIPGFGQVMKAFMKVWNEKMFKIQNMATNLRIDENQLPKYYNMLPPICEKLGIEIPELYLTLDPYPNAYTYGDTKPFVVITSGLLDYMPEELIPTVIAHECGHIACHHTLYHTMGQIIFSGASEFLSGISALILEPVKMAFYYWERCSEYSADRAAIICDGTSDKMFEVCMRFAGCNKNTLASINKEVFLNQAKDYKKMLDDSNLNKFMEFAQYAYATHPLNAVRAYEANEWGKSNRFKNICEYFDSEDKEDIHNNTLVYIDPNSLKNVHLNEVKNKLNEMGFDSISDNRIMEIETKNKPFDVINVKINGDDVLAEDFFKLDSHIELDYYGPKTDEEILKEHPGEIKVDSYKKYIGRNVYEVLKELKEKGFTNIKMSETIKSKFLWIDKTDSVSKIVIDGNENFEKDTWFKNSAEILLLYYIEV